jgi:peroxiredoxin Q/BCP
LRDNYTELFEHGYQVLGVSADPPASHKKFIEKYNLPFPLIADTDKKVHELYGTWGEKQMYGKKYMGTLRHTFVIDEEGKIEKHITKVKAKDHTAQVLN